jgi:hypothetical protein
MTDYTTVKLTETEVRALFKWLYIGQEEEAQLFDGGVNQRFDDTNAKARYKALANIQKKLEKEGWE